MKQDYAQLVQRYIAIWNLTDERRPQAVNDFCAEDVRYTDPNVSIQGREALSAYIGMTRARFRGMSFQVPGRVDGHHGQARFVWHCSAGGGDPAATGLDVALFRDGRLQALYGFFD
jgi:hypothetical protein